MGTSYNVIGTINTIGAANQVSAKLTKRLLVLDVEDGKYSQVIAVEFMGDKCAMLDEYQPGDRVDVEANLRGRAWTPPSGGETKYFVSLSAWKIARVGEARTASKPAEPKGCDSSKSDDDHLPF